MLFTIVFILAHFGVFYFTGTWKHWKDYYPTVLFVIIGDFSYNILFMERLLWKYNTLYDHRIADMVYAFLIFPYASMLFLRYYPKGLIKEGLYIFLWAALYTIIEGISFYSGGFIYSGNWNIYWSAGLYFIAFVMVRIHYIKPLIAWPISFCFAIVTMIIFKQPFHLSVTP